MPPLAAQAQPLGRNVAEPVLAYRPLGKEVDPSRSAMPHRSEHEEVPLVRPPARFMGRFRICAKECAESAPPKLQGR
eukprot:12450698-Alexandrium_andersonii.AAC.1